MRITLIICCLALIPGAGLGAPAGGDVEGLAEAIAFLGFDADQQQRLLRGEVVSGGIRTVAENELAVTVAMISSIPMAEVLEIARRADILRIDEDTLDFGRLDDGAQAAARLSGIRFGPQESEEIRLLLEARPGKALNLSPEEIERFRGLAAHYRGKKCPRDPACAEAVTDEYRKVLQARLEAYQKGGLAAIAPYARQGGKLTQPGEELLSSVRAADILADYLPEVYRLYLQYPKGDSEDFEHEFYWLKQRIQGRPTLILAHRIYYARPEFTLATERHFYAGHSYNAQQILLGILPQGDHSIIFYVNHTFSDQVSGFLSGTRRRIARKMMKAEILETFIEIQAYVERAGGP